MTDELADYQTAKAQGLRTYLGMSCRVCGSNVRRVCNRYCVACGKAADAARRANPTQAQREAERARKRTPEYRANKNARKSALIAATAPARAVARIERREAAKAQRMPQRRATQEARAFDLFERLCIREQESPARQAAFQRRALLRNREKASRRRMLKRYGEYHHKVDATTLAALLQSQSDACAYCGCKGDLHLDHKWPSSDGGPHAMRNLQYLCPPCNMSKRTTPDLVRRRMLGIPLITPWDGAWWRLECWIALAA